MADFLFKEIEDLAKEYRDIQIAIEYGNGGNDITMLELEKIMERKIVEVCKKEIEKKYEGEPDTEKRKHFNDLYNRIKEKIKLKIIEDIGYSTDTDILPTIVDRQIILNEYETFEVLLSKMSGVPIGQLPTDSLIKKIGSIGKPTEIELRVPITLQDEYTKEFIENPIIKEIKNERLIEVDSKNTYIIKKINYIDDKYIEVFAKSREIKLSNIDIELENCFITFFTKNKDREHYILNDLLFEQTGWKLGTVTDSVKFEPKTNHEKYIWIEGATKKWSEFLSQDICDRLECECYFDSKKKLVHLFKEEEISTHIGLYLSKDNFIKKLEKQLDSEKIVTRLKVEGNGEYTVADAMCTGSPFMENYLYFIQNREMSDELIEALGKYYSMVKKREVNWKGLVEEKIEKERQRDKLAYEFMNNQAMLTANNKTYDIYHNPINASLKEDSIIKRDMEREASILANISKLTHKIEDNKRDIRLLEEEISRLKIAIDNIVTLCQKKTCTDDNGKLIFNDSLLSELSEFTYTELYKNENFLSENAGDLINLAKKKLRELAFPTKEYNIDILNFKERIIPDTFFNWNGSLSLGDLIILYDSEKNEEEFLYFTGYEIDYSDKNINITISNKRSNHEANGFIADYLSRGKNALRDIERKKYLLNEQKYRLYNIPEYLIPKKQAAKPARPDGTTID